MILHLQRVQARLARSVCGVVANRTYKSLKCWSVVNAFGCCFRSFRNILVACGSLPLRQTSSAKLQYSMKLSASASRPSVYM